ncbi:Ig-like domain-containing protein [Rhabdochromatium marinum]|uniref:Ig-like domain-containing protein n=1 Tax=Rhabdochromatium marinum TaxID=48729 RepID=UPI0019086B80|nr:Ig-like domain-containing protein [Rhabdochromatium marinum]MBK1650395.1 hypothetical protein [Rhabdochromatium marinum]
MINLKEKYDIHNSSLNISLTKHKYTCYLVFFLLFLIATPSIGMEQLASPFIQNQGQFSEEIRYWTTNGNQSVSVSKDAIRYQATSQGTVLDEYLAGDQVAFDINPLDAATTRIHWFRGADSNRWYRDLEAYFSLSLGQITPGVRLELRRNKESAIEKVFHIRPHAKVDAIALDFAQPHDLDIDAQGRLRVALRNNVVFVFSAPIAYQLIEGKRKSVEVAYRLLTGGGYGFTLDDYDQNYPLVIDPSLVASTLIGGDAPESISALGTDSAGNLIAVGHTRFPYQDEIEPFPIVNGSYDTTVDGDKDVFVVRFDPDLEQLLDMTFIGGTDKDIAKSLAVMNDGAVLIVGQTDSGAAFPATTLPFGPEDSFDNYTVSFVSILSSDLSQLLSSAVFKTNGATWVQDVALDSQDNIFICGHTNSEGLIGTGYDTTKDGWEEVFVAKFDATLSNLLAATYLGGTATEHCSAIAVDQQNRIYVTGDVNYAVRPDLNQGVSLEYDFPTTNASWMPVGIGCHAGFVSRFDNQLRQLQASSFIAVTGSSETQCGFTTNNGYLYLKDLAIASDGTIYVAGDVDYGGLPITGGVQPDFPKDRDWADYPHKPFIVRMDSDLSSVEAATYFGGTTLSDDLAIGLSLDSAGNVILAGNAGSSTFPTTIDAYSRELNNGSVDPFVAIFDTDLSHLMYSTLLGGSRDDDLTSLALGSDDSIFIGGATYRAGSDPEQSFPTTETAFDQKNNQGGWDGFVARIEVPKVLSVVLDGAGTMVPGTEENFEISYRNTLGEVAENVVVLVDIPAGFEFSGDDGQAQFYAVGRCENRLFWSLGDLPEGSEGRLNFKMLVPAGTPTEDFEIMARISASNDPEENFDVTPYLDYTRVEVDTWRFMSLTESENVRAAHPDIDSLYQYALSNGYASSGTSTEVVMSNGQELWQFYLVDKNNGGMAVLSSSAVNAMIARHQGQTYSLFDQQGGFNWNRGIGIEYFDGNLSNLQYSSARADTQASSLSLTRSKCMFNCVINTIPAQALNKASFAVNAASIAIECIKCRQAATTGNTDEVSIRNNCAKCTASLAKQGTRSVPGIGDLVGIAIDTVQCKEDCSKDPYSHICVQGQEKYDCSCLANWWDNSRVCITQCDAKGDYQPLSKGVGCSSDFVDNDWVKHYCDAASCDPAKGWESCCVPKSKLCKEGEGCATATTKVRAAHDPNAKLAVPDGAVLAGSTIDYVLQYENTGEGTALGVFLVDALSESYDESTLVIGDGGTYDKASRLLHWDIGDVPAGQGGEVHFSVQLEADLAEGTNVSNQAKVYFPNALEVTPTNLIVHEITSLAAHNQRLEATAGTAVAVTLEGQGPAGLTYEILTEPLYGTIDGTLPQLGYTAQSGFSGIDRMTFRVRSGDRVSVPGTITFEVAPDPADTTPPEILFVFPEDGASNVPVSTEEIREGLYPPTIEAIFAEQVDITDASFSITGIDGEIEYDAGTQSVHFWPGQPLDNQQSYTVTLNGVKDLNGNPMASAVTWQFSTSSETTQPTESLIQYLDQGASTLTLSGSAAGSMRYLDFGGTDTYTLPTDLTGPVMLVDNQASTIHLPIGLNIQSAEFASDAVRFTINGHQVKLLGQPATFTFIFADTVARDFPETAATFGASIPAPGASPVLGTSVGSVDENGDITQIFF